jgi:hypothetical protein
MNRHLVMLDEELHELHVVGGRVGNTTIAFHGSV